MSMKIYRVSIGNEAGASREVKVPSKTDVQAGDAAAGQRNVWRSSMPGAEGRGRALSTRRP